MEEIQSKYSQCHVSVLSYSYHLLELHCFRCPSNRWGQCDLARTANDEVLAQRVCVKYDADGVALTLRPALCPGSGPRLLFRDMTTAAVAAGSRFPRAETKKECVPQGTRTKCPGPTVTSSTKQPALSRRLLRHVSSADWAQTPKQGVNSSRVSQAAPQNGVPGLAFAKYFWTESAWS